MRKKVQRIILGFAWIAALSSAVSCNSVNRESSPVKLVVTNSQNLRVIDLNGGVGCTQTVGTIQIRSLLLQPQGSTTLPVDNRLNDVIIDRYEVSYERTDGGATIPTPFVRTITATVTAGGVGDFVTQFVVFQPDAVRQAPFASLLPANGGRDPQTGKAFIQMAVSVTVFGATLAGERVSGTTKFALTFCFDCNGCQ